MRQLSPHLPNNVTTSKNVVSLEKVTYIGNSSINSLNQLTTLSPLMENLESEIDNVVDQSQEVNYFQLASNISDIASTSYYICM